MNYLHVNQRSIRTIVVNEFSFMHCVIQQFADSEELWAKLDDPRVVAVYVSATYMGDRIFTLGYVIANQLRYETYQLSSGESRLIFEKSNYTRYPFEKFKWLKEGF
jgi:hypothetical protein